MTDRITTRTVTGSATSTENGVFPLSYTNTGDTQELELTTTKALVTRTVVLPGGASYVKNYPATTNSRWHYPNIHGDNIATTNTTGTLQGTRKTYDPYGLALTTTSTVNAESSRVWWGLVELRRWQLAFTLSDGNVRRLRKFGITLTDWESMLPHRAL